MSALPQTTAECRESISVEGFESGSIDPELFDHEAHVYIAWLYLQQYDLEEAIAKFSSALRRLTKKLGIESKYHQTLTWFFLILIAERQASLKSDDWQSFRRANADIFATKPSIIKRYYSNERLDMSLARKQFLMPDRLPLP